LAKEVRQKTTPLDIPAVSGYVAEIGRLLAAQFPEARFPYTFHVIAGDAGGRTHKPMWLPAGYIFVPASLIRAAQNEAEFAGMIAHAMAHVAARHGIRPVTTGERPNPATVPLVFMGGWNEG